VIVPRSALHVTLAFNACVTVAVKVISGLDEVAEVAFGVTLIVIARGFDVGEAFTTLLAGPFPAALTEITSKS
jgi:hypothetical protein